MEIGEGVDNPYDADMRPTATILHLDLDAFFASVEQRDKPSLRGKPVIVGGTRDRGVVAAASYEARAFGVRSAMPTSQARRLCPNAAFLIPRFRAYQEASRAVMEQLLKITPVVEPLSLDEAFLDLGTTVSDLAEVTGTAQHLKAVVREATGLTASVGAGSSRLIAKIASDLEKPDGLVVVPPGSEAEFLAPMSVRVIPGVGPATAERLSRMGIETVADLAAREEAELVHDFGETHGPALSRKARGIDNTPVVADRETKSVSVEGTYEVDQRGTKVLEGLISRHAQSVSKRLRKSHLSGRTITVKVRLGDFSTHTRSATLPGPTDDPATITRLARALLAEVDTTDGVRLLGVGVSGLADWVQEDLFTVGDEPEEEPEAPELPRTQSGWPPGLDVVHTEHGPGWVWGSGKGVVTVRFETAETGPGPVRSFAAEDPALTRAGS